MSTLTKVFVVLLGFFSIAFTTMTVAIVAQQTKWRENAETWRADAEIAQTQLRQQISATAAEVATHVDRLRAQSGEILRIEKEKKDAQKENTRIKAELDLALNDKGSAEAMSGALVAQLQAAEKQREKYLEQRNGLEKRNIDLERRNIDLNDRVNEQTANIAVLVQQRRHFEQQINILRDENAKLALVARRAATGATMEDASGAAMTGVTALSPVAKTVIRGMVLEVRGDLVTISVGSGDGVEKGMVFAVHRDGQYLGDVEISLVEPDRSAGRLKNRVGSPQPNDRVTDVAGLASARR